jgi:RNA polymerase sigma-70 factor (ECF subfamily)
MNEEEKNIIESLKQGDNRAYKYIYDTHYVLLCKIAYEFLNDYFLAETIVNETISHLYEIRENFEITVSLRSYLIKSVRNRCINFLNLKYNRKESAFTSVVGHDSGNSNEWLNTIAGSEEHPLGILLEKEMENKIISAIEQLPNKSKTVFKMSRFENKSYDEIASILDISVNTVKYHIKNAIAKLAQEIDKYLHFHT